MSFGGHLRTLSGDARLSRVKLARGPRVPDSGLRNWKNDRGFPGVPAFLRLAEALGVPAERLAGGVNDLARDEANPAARKPHQPRKGLAP